MAAELPTDIGGLIVAFTTTADTITRSLRKVDETTAANAVLVELKDDAARLGAVDAAIQALDMDAMSLDELDVLGERAVDLADAQFELDEELDRISDFDLSAESKAVIETLRLP